MNGHHNLVQDVSVDNFFFVAGEDLLVASADKPFRCRTFY